MITHDIAQQIEDFQSGAIDCPTNFDQIGLLLLLAGEKCAIEWVIVSDLAAKPELCPPVDPRALSNAVGFLERLGLRVRSLAPRYEEVAVGSKPYATRIEIVIARADSDLEDAASLWGDQGVTQNPVNVRTHGRLSGIPSTSIEAYLTENLIEDHQLPLEVRRSPAYVFGRFRYSKDHWRQELETGERWAGVIEQYAPHLYQSYLAGHLYANTRKGDNVQD
jgi:hypothetical protein